VNIRTPDDFLEQEKRLHIHKRGGDPRLPEGQQAQRAW
jgi:hypothetical protein